MRHSVLSADDPKLHAIVRRIIFTWLKTLAGYSMMGLLIWAALVFAGSSYHFQLGFGLLWFVLPIVSWWFSAKISLMMMKCTPADPNDPEHKRLIDIVHRVWLKSGLKHEPPVYISDNPLPNAFATGPIHRKAVVAATKGLFLIGLNDDEIEAVFAHELSHVKNYDVGINSFLAVLSMWFFLITQAGVSTLLAGIRIFRSTFGLTESNPKRRSFFGGILSWIVFYVVFSITGQLTKLVQMFVVRSRESGADAMGAYMTHNPCALATGLEKLVAYVETHRPKAGREKEMWRAVRPIMTIDPLFDAVEPAAKPQNLWQRLRAFWQWLMLTHPTVPDRVHALEVMNGGVCPRPDLPPQS